MKILKKIDLQTGKSEVLPTVEVAGLTPLKALLSLPTAKLTNTVNVKLDIKVAILETFRSEYAKNKEERPALYIEPNGGDFEKLCGLKKVHAPGTKSSALNELIEAGVIYEMRKKNKTYYLTDEYHELLKAGDVDTMGITIRKSTDVSDSERKKALKETIKALQDELDELEGKDKQEGQETAERPLKTSKKTKSKTKASTKSTKKAGGYTPKDERPPFDKYEVYRMSKEGKKQREIREHFSVGMAKIKKAIEEVEQEYSSQEKSK